MDVLERPQRLGLRLERKEVLGVAPPDLLLLSLLCKPKIIATIVNLVSEINRFPS